MPEYNNPAGRILSVLTTLEPHKQGGTTQVLAEALGVPFDTSMITIGLGDLRIEFSNLKEMIESIKDNESKYKLYSSDISEIEQALNSITPGFVHGNYQSSINSGALIALRHIADFFDVEEDITDKEINDIRNSITVLQNEVELAVDINPTLREWLLDLIRSMRDGIDRFKIRGVRGLRKECYTILGNIMVNYKPKEKEIQKNKSIFQNLLVVFDNLTKFVKVKEEMQPILEQVVGLIGYST